MRSSRDRMEVHQRGKNEVDGRQDRASSEDMTDRHKLVCAFANQADEVSI
jgi:hypothetical protein